MNRLSTNTIDDICEMYRKGQSLNVIVKKSSLKKTTIYYHLRKKFGKKIKPVILNLENRQLLGEFIGAFAGDGNFYFRKKNYQYTIKFYFSNYEKEYAERMKEIIQILFSKKPYSYEIEKDNEIIVAIISKEIYCTLKSYLYWSGKKTYTVCLNKDIEKFDNDFLKGFIRGLINTDGSVYFPKNRISFGTTSEKLCSQTSQILNRFGINHSIYKIKGKNNKKPFYSINMMSIKEIKKFRDKIDLTNPFKKVQLESILDYAAMV